MAADDRPNITSDARSGRDDAQSRAAGIFLDWLDEERLLLQSERNSALDRGEEALASMRGVRVWYRRVVFVAAAITPLVLLALLFVAMRCGWLSDLGELAQAVFVLGTFSSFIVIYAFLLVAVSHSRAADGESKRGDDAAWKSAAVEAAKAAAEKSGS